jgi:hypothetical protein
LRRGWRPHDAGTAGGSRRRITIHRQPPEILQYFVFPDGFGNQREQQEGPPISRSTVQLQAQVNNLYSP